MQSATTTTTGTLKKKVDNNESMVKNRKASLSQIQGTSATSYHAINKSESGTYNHAIAFPII
jgi:hypothetical protein